MSAPRPILLLTRPRAQAEQFADLCRDRLGPDTPIVIAPLLEIRFLEPKLDPVDDFSVIATSVNGIEGLSRLADLAGRMAYCVGEATAAAATLAGMRTVSARGDAGDLIDAILAQPPREPLLYARGAVIRTDIQAQLRSAGLTVRSSVVYDQSAADLTDEAVALVRTDKPLVLPLFSPRSAALASAALADSRAGLHIAAMSEAVASEWTGPPPVTLSTARRPETDAMIDTVVQLYHGACS